MRWPFTMCGCTVMVSVARPGPTSTIFMPRPEEASSSFHIASAQARARSSGDSVALTFKRRLPFFLNVIVIDHDLFRNRFGLAGQDKARLQLPRLQRIIDIHRCLAFDQL